MYEPTTRELQEADVEEAEETEEAQTASRGKAKRSHKVSQTAVDQEDDELSESEDSDDDENTMASVFQQLRDSVQMEGGPEELSDDDLDLTPARKRFKDVAHPSPFPSLKHLPPGRSLKERRRARSETFTTLICNPESNGLWNPLYSYALSGLCQGLRFKACRAVTFRTMKNRSEALSFLEKGHWYTTRVSKGKEVCIPEATVQVRCNVIAVVFELLPWMVQQPSLKEAIGSSAWRELQVKCTPTYPTNVPDAAEIVDNIHDRLRKLAEYNQSLSPAIVAVLAAFAAAWQVLYFPPDWTINHLYKLFKAFKADPNLLKEPLAILCDGGAARLKLDDVVQPMTKRKPAAKSGGFLASVITIRVVDWDFDDSTEASVVVVARKAQVRSHKRAGDADNCTLKYLCTKRVPASTLTNEFAALEPLVEAALEKAKLDERLWSVALPEPYLDFEIGKDPFDDC